MRLLLLCILLALSNGCIEIVSKPVPPTRVAAPEVSNILLELINLHEKQPIDAKDYQSTSLGVLITLGTPAGYRLKLRYHELGVSLVEGLKLSRDSNLLQRLFELAQWSNESRVRSESLVTLGSFSDPDDQQFFETALADKDVGIRFAAVEALQLWGQPAAVPLLRKTMMDTWSPLVQIYAAQAALSLGDKSGLPLLYKGIESRSWIVRAMSANYLGDYADPADYNRLYLALNSEAQNDFVTAELAIATLKLLSKLEKNTAVAASGGAPNDKQDVAYWIGKEGAVEMEPLIIFPPRMLLPQSAPISQTINNKLIYLIQNRLGVPLSSSDQQDPNLQDLNHMLTPAGFALQIRYSELSVAVSEGLGGTNDPLLRTQLGNLSETNRNPVARATALVSLGYNRNKQDLVHITNALSSPDPIIRFGAMEAVMVGRFKDALPDISALAASDPVPAFRIFALAILVVFENPSAKTRLIDNFENPDWPARAMSFWYVGRYGSTDDFSMVLSKLSTEKNPFVLAEIALALQRLAR